MSFFSRKIVSIFKVEYLENGLADFNDFGLILQDFERSFRWNQLVLALQFSFKVDLTEFLVYESVVCWRHGSKSTILVLILRAR